MKIKSLALTFVLSCFSALNMVAQVPGIVSHQGKITVNGTNYTGVGLFKFALIDAAGDTTYWSNDGSSVAGVEPAAAISLSVTRGVFSVNLGDLTVANMTQAIAPGVFTNSGVYLRVWFNDGLDGSQLLSPDRQITTVAYAFQAASAASYAETDPIFSASPAAGITVDQTNNWNTAFSWGNHADAGYLTAETDPVFSASAAAGITPGAIGNWNTAYGWGNHASAGYLTQTSGDARYALIGNVYSKSQSDARYLTGFTETDPIFSASPAGGIQTSDLTNWNAKIGGSGSAGYLSKFTAGGALTNSVIAENNGKIGVGTASPGQALEVNGTVKSSTGGFMFPDGTVQTTAATNTTSSSGGGSSALLVEAFLTSDASLTSGGLTQIVFNNATVNVNGALSGGSFTVPLTGIYNIQFTIVSPSTTGHVKQAILEDNGTVMFQGPSVSGSAAYANGYVAPLTFTGPLTAGHLISFHTEMSVASSVVASSGQSLAKTSLVIVKLP